MLENSVLNTARDEGFVKGIEKGIEQGKEVGEKQKAIDIAKKLLKQNVDINIIIASTDLTLNEIEELKSSLNPTL